MRLNFRAFSVQPHFPWTTQQTILAYFCRFPDLKVVYSFTMSDTSSTTSSDNERFEFRVTDSYGHSFLGQPGFNLKPDIWHSWLDFVYSERIQAGLSTFMETKPRGRGCCGLSRQSYPH
jgi:hypothetical protein